jgi:tellurite resistance protein TehA-like permease
MMDGSTILYFDGTITTGLFVYYAFLATLAQRFEREKHEAHISHPIRYLSSVQLVFVVSAILVLSGFSDWAIIMSVIGLFLLIVYFLLLILHVRYFQVEFISKFEGEIRNPES